MDPRGAKESARRASLYNRAISTLDRSVPDIDVLADMIAWSERRGNVAPNTPDTIILVNGLGGKGLMRPPIAPLEPQTSHKEEDEALAVDAARASILYPADKRAS
ncbi:hypothetical protein [Tabrizicola soli]|uniref:Uncharacterized protein n=1 Tax=Tabrizicola soli TaxID=2185115 RepID=A0ABV7DX12_9RHOB|nr:hypothetical protein [Tabrizicola soli]